MSGPTRYRQDGEPYEPEPDGDELPADIDDELDAIRREPDDLGRVARPDGAQDRPTDPVDEVTNGLLGIVQNGGEGDVLQQLARLGDT